MQDILKIIQERHSTRAPYDPDRQISKQDLRQILEAARWAPTAHNMQNFEIIVVNDKKVLDEIGAIKSTVSEIFIRENYNQLSFSEEELRRKKVGILGTMFPTSWVTPGVKPVIEENRGRSFAVCPTLLVVLYDPSRRAPASEGDFFGIISLGCMLENLWLEASALGIDVHIVSSLGSGMGSYSVEKEVKRILAVPEKLKIVFTIRLGYVAKLSHALRVRRDIEDLCHHNTFGKMGID
jgi:nitroreductase